MARRSKKQNPVCDEYMFLSDYLGQVEHELIWSFVYENCDSIPVAVFHVSKRIQNFCKRHMTTLNAAEFDIRSMGELCCLGCTAVTSLDMSNMDWLDDDCLRTLAGFERTVARLRPKPRRHCPAPLPNLRNINVSFCSGVTGVGVRMLGHKEVR